MTFENYIINDVIEEIIDYRGKTPKKLGGDWSPIPTKFKALSAKNIKGGRIVQQDTIRYVDDEMYFKWMKQEVNKGTILITSEAPFGELLYWDSDEKIVLSQRLFGLKIKKEFNPRYVYYYMFSKKFQAELSGRATGSTVTGLRQPELLKCNINIPEKEIQDKIANILKIIDKKIDLNNKINNNLYKILTTLYKESLNNFKSKEEKTLDEFCNIFTGKKNANEYDEYGKNKFFTCGDKTLKINSYIYNGPAIIISGNGSYTGRTQFYNGKFDLYQRTYACTIKNDVNEDYIYALYTIVKNELVNKINGGTHGSAIPYIVMNDLAKFKIYFDDESLKKLSRQAKIILQKIQLNDEENETLSQLRDTLLPKLMNGEIDLDNIEI